jgi:hypothetical protein
MRRTCRHRREWNDADRHADNLADGFHDEETGARPHEELLLHVPAVVGVCDPVAQGQPLSRYASATAVT